MGRFLITQIGSVLPREIFQYIWEISLSHRVISMRSRLLCVLMTRESIGMDRSMFLTRICGIPNIERIFVRKIEGDHWVNLGKTRTCEIVQRA